MNLSVLINSCDKYEFIWEKFYKLFMKYWDFNINVPVYFLTENKPITYPEFIPITPGQGSFTQIAFKALNYIKTPHVLWLQEDYFLKRKIEKSQFEEYLDFIQYYNTDRFGIHSHSYLYSLSNVPNCKYLKYKQNSLYTISLQASIWKTSFFQKCLQDKDENIWQFEVNGTYRLNLNNHKVYVHLQNPDWYQEALRKGQFTDNYHDICREENL